MMGMNTMATTNDGYQSLTKSGHDFYDMASALQKGIRRGDYNLAGYAANELIGKYRAFLWKRLLIISAEDCYGIMTKEIVALKEADEMAGNKDHIFAAKAIVLLCMALKNRDADYFACNFMHASKPINPEDIKHTPLSECELPGGEIPDYVHDCHTFTGKQMGKTVRNMVHDEQKALNPLQLNLFDNESWEPFFDHKKI